MAIKKDTLDQLLEGRDPKAVFSKDGLVDELKKALAERTSWPRGSLARRPRRQPASGRGSPVAAQALQASVIEA